MMGPERQREILGRLADAAKTVGLYVAPIGSGYYFVQQPEGLETKDFDAVVHAEDLAVAELDAVVEMAKLLGQYEVSRDRAVVVSRGASRLKQTQPHVARRIRLES